MQYPNIFESKIKVQSYLIDDEMQLSMPGLFGLIQEISSEHVSLCNIGWQHLKSKNLFWVLSKIQLQIQRLPQWSENIILRTWGKKPDLLVNPRDYEIVTENNELLLKGTSTWLILDGITGKIQKLDQFDENLVYPKDLSAIDERPGKVQKIDISGKCKYSHVLNSDIDMNKHVNNSHYIQWAVDSVSLFFKKSYRLKNAIVNYISQAKLGDMYGVISKRISKNLFITSIFSQEDNKEFCRIQSEWEAK